MKANRAAHSHYMPCAGRLRQWVHYAWQRRGASARCQQGSAIARADPHVHAQSSRATYGASRIPRDLRAAGARVGRKRAARLLRQAGLHGGSRPKWPVTTVCAAQSVRRPAWCSGHSSLDYEPPLAFECRHAEVGEERPARRIQRNVRGRAHRPSGLLRPRVPSTSTRSRAGGDVTRLWKLPEPWTHTAASTAPWKTTEQVFHSYDRPSSS
jgi:HTH-like domain